MPKNPITMEKHRELGLQFTRQRTELLDVIGIARDRAIDTLARKALRMVDQMRGRLEEEMYRTYPIQSSVDIYYPSPEMLKQRVGEKKT